MTNRLLKYVDDPADTERGVSRASTNVVDLVAVLQEQLQRAYSGKKKAMPEKIADVGAFSSRPYWMAFGGANSWEDLFHQYGRSETVDVEPTVYRVGQIETGAAITAIQLFNLVIAGSVFGVGLCLTVISLVVIQIAAIAPWFFWLVPTIGAFGIVMGVCLNILKDSAKS